MEALQFLNPIRNLLRIFSQERTPRQLAMGIALGVVIGLLPKGNLIAVSLTVVLFSLRVNLGSGLTTVFLVSLAHPLIAPIAHEFGLRALRNPRVYSFLSHIYQYPLVPWTALNHSVVIGSLLLGVAMFYPSYHVSLQVLTRLQPVWQRVVRRQAETAAVVTTE